MERVKHLVKKEFLQFRNDRRMIMISILSPVMQLILLGYAANIDVKDINLYICDMNKSSLSRGYIESVTNSKYFNVVGYTDRVNDIEKNIDNGKAAIAVVIPVNFSKNINEGKTANIQAMIDGSDSNTANIGMNYLSMLTMNYSKNLMEEKQGGLKLNIQPINSNIRVWYNPELKSKNYMIPGILGLLLMMITMMLTSLAIVKEKEIGTLEQLIVTPLKPLELMLGKLLPFTIIGFVDIFLVLTVSAVVFQVYVKGSILLLLLLSIIYLISTLGLGLFISTVANNQQQAMMTSIFFIMLPMIYLSGFIFPIENMPKVIQYLTYLMPLRYFFVIIRGIFLKGIGIIELWKEALLLLILGVSIFSLSVARFHKRLN